MKIIKFLILLLLPFFLFSQEKDEIPVVDFVKGDYPMNKSVKILYDKYWKPTINIDSALYYREIKIL